MSNQGKGLLRDIDDFLRRTKEAEGQPLTAEEMDNAERILGDAALGALAMLGAVREAAARAGALSPGHGWVSERLDGLHGARLQALSDRVWDARFLIERARQEGLATVSREALSQSMRDVFDVAIPYVESARELLARAESSGPSL